MDNDNKGPNADNDGNEADVEDHGTDEVLGNRSKEVEHHDQGEIECSGRQHEHQGSGSKHEHQGTGSQHEKEKKNIN